LTRSAKELLLAWQGWTSEPLPLLEPVPAPDQRAAWGVRFSQAIIAE
jgi:hypothetical protein